MKTVFTIIIVITSLVARAQTDNEELQKMYNEDQQARMSGNINWVELNKKDSLRQIRADELMKEGKIVTGKDYYNAAMIFQHGDDTIASGKAVTYMRKALQLDSSVNRWLLAAAIDRDLMRKGRPQIYGTQYISNKSTGGKMRLYQIDTTKVSDAERIYYRVETLAQQKAKERSFNLKPITDLYYNTRSIAELITLIKKEFAKKDASTINVSETAINEFGYQLLKENKKTDALDIFRLNTELYPEGFNTWDSLGECLLLLGKKEEGMAAYKKSLRLNPNNDNAKKILAENKELPRQH